ncbi:helix-turn-helix domain-containing protein [Lactobacillus porci]|uniref:Helix-turn-helix domain-containing protein n=1 Tax=Lactobacillus porci TaxID=2012477 RepID=A0A6A8MAC0_9LACO|nr:helix-turn-helix domain-containing protein [Lactobacillus porci]MST86638.1 helix-turn-helix domain-containing protein [Lactobacillus porci]
MSGIGEKLRKAREAKGLSISDIEKTTKIQSRYLEAIENNEFDKLPGDFYVRAFIRQYAQIVGLDGKELLNEYSEAPVNEVSNEDYAEAEQPAEEEEAEPEKPEEPEPKAEPEPRYEAPARPAAPQAPRKPAENRGSDNAKWRRLVPRLAIGCGIALLVLVAAIAFANSRKGQNTAGEGASGSSVTISSKKKSSKKSSSASSSSKKKTSAVKVAKLGGNAYRVTGLKSSAPLVVRSSSQSIYYYVSVNNAITNQGTLQSGEKHTESVKNNSIVIVYLGTDTGVSVTVAGKKIPFTPVNGTSRLTIYLGKESSSSQSSSTTHQSSTSTQSSYSSASRSQASSSSSRASSAPSSQSHASSASSASSSSSQQSSSSSQRDTSSSSQRVNAAKSSAPAVSSSSSVASSNK